jgi:hypothetical protein
MTVRSLNVTGGMGPMQGSDEIDALSKAIDEDTAEHDKAMRDFDIAMREFASDRSLETCLGALNVSIQISNLRYKLFQSYMQYSRLLEREINRLQRLGSIHT